MFLFWAVAGIVAWVIVAMLVLAFMFFWKWALLATLLFLLWRALRHPDLWGPPR